MRQPARVDDARQHVAAPGVGAQRIALGAARQRLARARSGPRSTRRWGRPARATGRRRPARRAASSRPTPMRRPQAAAPAARAGASVGPITPGLHGVVAGDALSGRPRVAWAPRVRQRRIGPGAARREGAGRERARAAIGGWPSIVASRSPGLASRTDDSQQGRRVGVPGRSQQPRRRTELDDAPGVHGRDAVGHALEQAQVVGDDDDRRAQLPHQRHERLDDLHLHQRVERGGGLVGDDQLGLARERRGDGRALQHPARELVGVAPHHGLRLGHAQARQQVGHARVGLARPTAPGAAPAAGAPAVPCAAAGRRSGTGPGARS